MVASRSTGRLGGLCGALFSVLYFVGTGLLAGPISQSDSLETAKTTFNEQADRFDVGASLLLVSTPFLLLFVQALLAHLTRAEEPTGTTSSLAVISTAAGAATTLVGAALMGGTAFLAEVTPVDGPTAAFSHSAAEACIFYAMTFFGVAALATARVIFRYSAFPTWFGWVATVLGAGMVAGSAASPLIRSSALLAGLSTYLFFAIGSFAVWKYAASGSSRSRVRPGSEPSSLQP